MEKLKINKEFEQFAQQKQQIRRLWNIEERSAKLLYMLIRMKQPKHILEIGTSNGYSTFWLSLAAGNFGGDVTTIEVDEKRFLLAQENLSNCDNIIMHQGLAEKVIPTLDEIFDFVFIDAGKIGYIDYIQLLIDKLSNQAVIVADNVISHGHSVNEYLDFIETNEKFESFKLDLDAGLEISIFNK